MQRLIGAVAVSLALGSGRASPLLAQREPAREVVARALRAVEGDSASGVTERWRARVRRAGSDRAALLGLAEIARLTYATDADGLYRKVLARASADSYSAYARIGLGTLTYDGGRVPQAIAQFDSGRAVALLAGDASAQALAIMRAGYAAATTAGPAAGLAAFAVAERVLPADAQDLRAELLYRRALMLAVEAKPEARAVAWSSIAL